MSDQQVDAEIRVALKLTIIHWKRMRDDPNCGEQPGTVDCPFCTLFAAKACEGCPIWVKTGRIGCAKTPYAKAETAFRKLQVGEGTEAVWQKAAQKEIDFLESLLLTEEKEIKFAFD